jgi:hypothetical protein
VEIVLVHINTRIPQFVKLNLIRLKRQFPANKVVLISNMQQPRVQGVELRVITEPKQATELRALISHPKDFRFNFWHSSIARFTYLLAYQVESREPLIHIESDVILSKDFPIQKFNNETKLAFPILSQYRGVASVFYTPNSDLLEKFIEYIVEAAKNNPEITDMIALRLFFDSHPQFVELLPAGPSNIEVYSPKIKEDIYELLISKLNKYQGIFDGSDIGMFLFGTDPRNALGTTYLHKEVDTTYTQMLEMKFRYNAERDFLDVENQGAWTPIYSIHMTCKDIKLFTTRNMKTVFSKYLRIESYKEVFLVKVYIRMGIAKIVRTMRMVYR